jgi:hypothetical protein
LLTTFAVPQATKTCKMPFHFSHSIFLPFDMCSSLLRHLRPRLLYSNSYAPARLPVDEASAEVFMPDSDRPPKPGMEPRGRTFNVSVSVNSHYALRICLTIHPHTLTYWHCIRCPFFSSSSGLIDQTRTESQSA